jgi:hypothetical protein
LHFISVASGVWSADGFSVSAITSALYANVVGARIGPGQGGNALSSTGGYPFRFFGGKSRPVRSLTQGAIRWTRRAVAWAGAHLR